MVRKLAAILRIAEGLDRGNIGIVRSVECKLSRQKVESGFAKNVAPVVTPNLRYGEPTVKKCCFRKSMPAKSALLRRNRLFFL